MLARKQRDYKVFSINKKQLKNKTKKKRNREETVKTLRYKTKFIENMKLMQRSSSNIVDNLIEKLRTKYLDAKRAKLDIRIVDVISICKP